MKKITLACEVCKNKNYYENNSSNSKILSKNKFCKKCNKYQIHKEEK